MTVEELQIVISAKIDGVLDKVQKVKDKVAGIQPKKSPELNVSTSKAQGNLKELQAEIDRTQAKIQKLADKQSAVQSEINARAGMYSDVPNLTGMGREETFGTLMERDPKVQKLQEQMSALDAQTAPLKAHLAETKAQIAAAGNAAEPAAEKTRQLGESMRTAGGHIQNATRNGGNFSRMTSRMLLSMLLYQGVSSVFRSISEGVQNMALGSAQANVTMSQLATSSLYLKNSFGAALLPILQALTPAFMELSSAIADVLQKISMFFAALSGKSSVLVAKQAQVDYAKTISRSGNDAAQVQQKQAAAAEKAAKRAAEAQEKAAARQSAAEKRVQDAIDEHQKKLDALKKSIMGFDQLNVLSAPADTWKAPTVPDYTSKVPTASSLNTAAAPAWNGMPSPGDMFKSVNIPQKMSDTVNKVKQILNDLKQYLLGIGLIAAGAIICLFGNPGLGIALMISGFLTLGYEMVKNNDSMSGRVRLELASVMRIIGTMLFAIGTILMLAGNLGLGIALIIAGAASFGIAAKLDFDSTKSTVKQKLADILAIVGAVLAAIGIILVITGFLPLGIGLIIAGAAALGASVGLNFSAMPDQAKKTLTRILTIVGPIIAAIGIILVCTGVGIPLGIGLIIAGAAALGTAAALNWETIKTQIYSHLSGILVGIGAFSLALGLMLVLTGVMLPLGIALIAVGAASLAGAAALNWSAIKDKVKTVLSDILAIASVSAVAIGLLLCLTGVGIPLGIGLIIAGMAGIHAASSISTNPITTWAKGLMNGVIGVFESGINWIISMLDKVSFTVPSWVAGIGGQTYGINISPVHIPRLATGGLITGPTYSLIGEGKDNEAVLPLNTDVYSRIGKGIAESHGSTDENDAERIVERLDRLETAIRDMKVVLYSSDRKIAESANRGNQQIDRCYHPIAQT